MVFLLWLGALILAINAFVVYGTYRRGKAIEEGSTRAGRTRDQRFVAGICQ